MYLQPLPRALQSLSIQLSGNRTVIIRTSIMLLAEKIIGIANISSLTVTNEYNLIKDLIFYSGKGKYSSLNPALFLFFFLKMRIAQTFN